MGAKLSLSGKHVLVTGGSQGIGYALADRAAKEASHVTIIARSSESLRLAKQELQERHPNCKIAALSVDVGDSQAVKSSLADAERDHGPVDIAICNAGVCIPKLLVEQDIAEAELTMQVNYFGSYYVAKALLPGMLSRRCGHVCFISSMLVVNPMAGFTSYGPSKCAVRSLADCLRSEVQGTGVSVSIAYPPDTQTPGFDKENESKPGPTRAICETFQEQVHQPDHVAALILREMCKGRYHLLNPDILHALGISLVAGMTPRPRWLVLEVIMAPLLVLVAAVSYMIQDRIVWRYNTRACVKDAPSS